MGDGFKRRIEYDLMYDTCIYSGISKKIEWEMKYGSQDETDELQYIVDRYYDEVGGSAIYLQEKMDEYKVFAKEKYGTKD